jgi:hypothetical protein
MAWKCPNSVEPRANRSPASSARKPGTARECSSSA